MRPVAQQALASPLIEFFGAVTIVGLLTYARTQIKAGTMTAGEFTSFVVALLMLYEPVKRLSRVNNVIQQGIAGATRVFEVLDTLPEVAESKEARALPPVAREIAFDRVCFRYADDGEYVLKDIDFRVPAGKMVARGRGARVRPVDSDPAPIRGEPGVYPLEPAHPGRPGRRGSADAYFVERGCV